MIDLLAFGPSTTSVFYNYAAMTLNFFQPRDHQQRALFFTTYSILLLLVAFVSGTYTVVPHTMGMTTAVVVCCCFFSNQILSLPELLVLTCASLTQSFAREEKQEIDEEKPRDDSKASPVQEWFERRRASKLCFASWYGHIWNKGMLSVWRNHYQDHLMESSCVYKACSKAFGVFVCCFLCVGIWFFFFNGRVLVWLYYLYFE